MAAPRNISKKESETLIAQVEFLRTKELEVNYEVDHIYIKKGGITLTLNNYDEFLGFYKGFKFQLMQN